ncbi:S-layer family protein [Scytonema sp. PRP1]|uniref:S-layer family protein n=1 Tax=Scytonema sp. PRP1 TaxID=3120513 RepID=UPI00300D83D4
MITAKANQPNPRLNSSQPGLEVSEGKTLGLVGGNVSISGGILKSPAGRIEIGSVGSNGTVSLASIEQGWKLGYEGTTSFADIGLTEKSFLSATGDGGGAIAITGRNINISSESILRSDTLGDKNGQQISILGDAIDVDRSNIGANSFSSGNGGQIKLEANNITLKNNGGGGTQATASRSAGDITIIAKNSFVARDYSWLVSKTSSGATGNGGAINIKANSFEVNNSWLVSDNYGAGNGGVINVEANSFEVNNSGLLSYNYGAGNGGVINVEANSFEVNNSGLVSYNYGAGNGGVINVIAANSLLIENSSVLSSRTENTGQAGEINLNVADSIVLKRSSINTETNSTADAGDLTLNARTLLVQDGSQVATSALGSGNAGEITLKADTISLSGAKSGVYNTLGSTSAPVIKVINVEYDDKGPVPKVTIEPRPQTILPNAQGNSGNINISARLLSVTDGAQLTTSTYGKGNAGTINVNTVNSVFSGADTSGSSSGAFSAVEENAVGNAGAIKITTNELAVDNGAQLVASSLGEGDAGTITIQASDKVSVNGDSRNSSPTGVFAESTTGRGGDIGLTIGNLLLLRSRGLISATSGVAGQDGIDGNIDINTKFVIAFPLENSDIIATGFGRSPGSNIRVNAQGIFGTQFRQQLTPESDIVATGTVTLNTPDVDQTLGFVELPIALTDTSELIASTSCGAIASTDSDTQKSSFTITGRGGLPPSPYEPLSSDVLWSDNRIPNIASQQRTEKPSTKPPTAYDAVKIVPATGWVFDGKGHVTLISHASNANNFGSTPACQKK